MIAVMGNDALRFILSICILFSFELSCDYARPHSFSTATPLRESSHVGEAGFLGVHLYRGIDVGSGPPLELSPPSFEPARANAYTLLFLVAAGGVPW